MRIRWDVAAVAAVAPVAFLTTQAAEPVQSNRAEVYVAVATAAGAPVRGLGAGDLVVKVDGQDREVIDARPATAPLSLVFVVDVSLDDVPKARAALGSAVAALRRHSPDARVGATERLKRSVKLAPVGDGSAVDRMLARIIQGSYGLLPDLLEATRVLAKEPTARRVAVVIKSLTPDTRSVTEGITAEQVADALRQAGVALWVVEFGGALRLTGTTDLEKVLTDVARFSGGRREVLNTRLSLEAAVERTIHLLQAQYLVTYADSRSPASSDGLRVGVRRDGIQVFAPGWKGR